MPGDFSITPQQDPGALGHHGLAAAGPDLHRAAQPQDAAVGGALSMTTQDIYSWVQMGLQVLIGGGIVAGVYRYFGVLKRAIESQEKTIAAQAEHMKSLTTALQESERLSKTMKLVVDTVGDPAVLQREQAYRERMERDAAARIETVTAQVQQNAEQVIEGMAKLTLDAFGMIGHLLAYLPPEQAQRLIGTSRLDSDMKAHMSQLLREEPQESIGRIQTLGQVLGLTP
jgi:hypothetical protein